MNALLDMLISFPTVVWTVPLGVVMCFGLLTILGAMDLDSLDVDVGGEVDADIDLDLDVDAEVHHGGLFHGLGEALALGTVPLTIVVASITTIGWIASLVTDATIGATAREVVGPWIYSAAVIAATFVLALWLTTHVVKPLKPVFVTHTEREGDAMLGRLATLTSSRVTATFGTAVSKASDGTTLNLNVVCDEPTSLSVGDEVTIVAYDAENRHYVIAPMDASKRIAVTASDSPPGAAERLPSDLTSERGNRPGDGSGETA